ncbi:MAG: MOSC domain-containing protein [Acidimicrobiia bacterium]
MARPTVVVDTWTYEGVDAHRTLQHLGDLWLHHAHGRTPSDAAQQRSGEALAALFAPLAGDDDSSLAPYRRVKLLGERAAARIDQLDSRQLQQALREMWSVLAALAEDDATSPTGAAQGVVAGLFLSDGGVPKTAVDSSEIGWRGVLGDRQASRAHHGRPWQAVCLWSADIVADLAQAGHPIRPGSAGENVSIRGLDWSAAKPGARLTLGTAVLALSAYAIPCSKNARWFADGDYERMSHERSDRSRLYARVEQPGRVSVGDTVRLAG